MATLNLSIPDAIQEWIDARIAAGEYADASEYVRELIRQDQLAREVLRSALMEGEKSGQSARTVTDIARQTKRRVTRA